MISGNCNRSPQYTTMGPPPHTANHRHPFANQTHHYQQPQAHVLLMSGGSVRGIPQVSRGFTMMSNAPVHPLAGQSNMPQNFGFGHAYPPHHSSPHIFHRPHNYYHQQQPMDQPHLIHHIPQQQQQQQQRSSHHHHYHHFRHKPSQHPSKHFNPQPYMTPPPALPMPAEAPSSGFINGIKNMVKGIIQPLNCDFYSDHQEHYNPKFRNFASEIDMSYFPQHNTEPPPHTQVIDSGVKNSKTMTATGSLFATTPVSPTVPKPREIVVPPKKSPNYFTEVMAMFSSEDFPELPAPRRSRSTTPAKTEKPSEQVIKAQKEATPPKQQTPLVTTAATSALATTPSVASSQSSTIQPAPISAMPLSNKSSSRSCPVRKSIFFEICNSSKPTGRRPTFGGRMKIVPPPFTLNKCHPPATTASSLSQDSSAKSSLELDSDTDDSSFVMLPDKALDNCLTAVCLNRPPRQRNLSECSDDSFVVFYAEGAESEFDLGDDDDDDDDEEDEEDTSSEEDDDDEESDNDFDTDSDSESENGDKQLETGTDVVDCSPGIVKQNETDRIKFIAGSALQYSDLPCHHVQLDSGFDEKKVTFSEQPEVHVMHAWNYAYRAARKGHWEDVARDRSRFQKRIERTAVYINPILTPEHREKVYRARFGDDNNQQQQHQANKHLENRSQSTVDCSNNNKQTKVDETTLLC